MNEIVPQKNEMMQPQMMPMMLGNIIPPQIPQMQYEGGLIKKWYQNAKLDAMREAAESEAQIAEQRRKQLEHNLAIVEQVATFSDRLKLSFKKIEYESKMLDLTVQREQAELNYRILEGQEKQMEIKLKEHQIRQAEIEANISELDYKARLKAMTEELGGSFDEYTGEVFDD